MESLAQFHAQHYRTSSSLQRAMDRVTETLGRPTLAVFAIAALVLAVAFAAMSHSTDRALFEILEFAATLAGIGLALLILVTQRREDQLAENQSKLTLELALLSDRRTAKLIALVEELRRDSATVPNRRDLESEEMAAPVDPGKVMAAIEKRTPGGGEA